jgi:PAS domain S-box-containing protein
MDGFAKEKNIKLKIDVGEIPIIHADPDRISQVLRNLISNAIKFSNEKSKIIISAYKNDDYVLFCVQDYGCGLTLENQMRVFEPFYQVENINHRHLGGTGLGLTICRGIVESQKGKIWVESKIDHGSKFYFTFPLNPVREIEPIKVLFSQKVTIDKKVKEEFKKILGVLGIHKFEELKTKNKINKEDIFMYIDSLRYQHILTDEMSKIFKIDIGKIFGDEKEVIKNKIKVVVPKNAKLDDKWSEHEFDSVFIFDENANILDCNDNMSKRLGYTKSEILSLNITDIDVLESKKDIINKIKKIKKDGVISFKTMHKRKDGSAILVYENLQYNKNKNQFKGIIREDYLVEKSLK